VTFLDSISGVFLLWLLGMLLLFGWLWKLAKGGRPVDFKLDIGPMKLHISSGDSETDKPKVASST
jgi:hypothetical protein